MSDHRCGLCWFWNNREKRKSDIREGVYVAACLWKPNKSQVYPESFYTLHMFSDYGRTCKRFRDRRLGAPNS